MSFWAPSDVTEATLNSLVSRKLLCPLTGAEEWKVPQGEWVPAPPPGYIVSFVRFHERGFASPSHRFFRGLLLHYGLELQHLNPNGIQHIATFIALCEGFLGVPPVFKFFLYFFLRLPHQGEGGG